MWKIPPLRSSRRESYCFSELLYPWYNVAGVSIFHQPRSGITLGRTYGGPCSRTALPDLRRQRCRLGRERQQL